MSDMAFNVERRRSLVKAITFRVVVIASDTVVIYLITRRVDLTAGLVVFTNIASTIEYFLHERAWNKISWGRDEAPDRNQFPAPV